MSFEQSEFFTADDLFGDSASPERVFVPGFALPAFLPGLTSGPASITDDLVELLKSERSALIVVDGRGDLPALLMSASRELDVQLLITVCPGGSLPSSDGHDGIDSGRVRAIALGWGERLPDVLMLSRGTDSCLRLSIGAGSIDGVRGSACGVALMADGGLAHDVQEWFIKLWAAAAPLNDHTPAAPIFGQAPAAPALEEWESFRRRLAATSEEANRLDCHSDAGHTDPGHGSVVIGDPEAGHGEEVTSMSATLEDESSESTASSRSVVDVRPASSIERDISALYQRGRLVTVSATKIPTFRLQVEEFLELPRRSSFGPATASSPIYLSLLDEDHRSQVQALVGEAKWILNRHSFGLGDNHRWVPTAAHEHFVKRLSSMPVIEDVRELLGRDIEDYVDARIDALLEALDVVLRHQRIAVGITSTVAERLAMAAVAYFKEHATVAVRATHNREALAFLGGDESDYERPANLLRDALRLTRERMANPGSQAKREVEGPPISTMDVVGGDGLLHEEPCGRVRIAAHRQLERMRSLPADMSSDEVCAALLGILRSST